MALEFHGLDDQSYESIMEQVRSRLPWLCPAWTDHNSHDPGITVLELMAWYKELQQYYMAQMTTPVRTALLRLAGMEPEGPHAASCMVEPEPGGPARLAGTQLHTPQGILFELPEPIPALRTRLDALRIVRGGTEYDVRTLARGDAAFRPFAFEAADRSESAAFPDDALLSPGRYPAGPGRARLSPGGGLSAAGEQGAVLSPGGSLSSGGGTDSSGGVGNRRDSVLRLGFSGRPRGELRLWFDVEEPEGSRRNPPDSQSLPPRTILWEPEGCPAVEPVQDDTWSLSWSGYVTLSAPDGWKRGKDDLYWLTVRQAESGCEEDVRLSAVSANRFRCVQRETRVRRYGFRVEKKLGREILIRNAQARYASLGVFLRTENGWEQTLDYQTAVLAEGRLIRLDGTRCVQDGEDNLLAVCQDTLTPLLYDTLGLPGERLSLDLDGKQVLDIELICQTLEPDGTVRPALWRRTADLASCSPRDFVFFWDEAREQIVFGDGLHGAVPEPGEGSVMVSSLVLSECGGGNIPADADLTFTEDGERVENSAASGGRDRESLEEVRGRLLRKLADTDKCQSAADFARCALRTPGLRLAGAKAVPGYDPAMGPDRRHGSFVSVVVLPDSERDCPMPDGRFLAAADRQLDRFRPVCVQARAIPPRYVPLSIAALARVEQGADRQEIEQYLRAALRPRAGLTGETVRRDDILALLQKMPGVLQAQRVELRPLGPGGYLTPEGDLRLPPDGLPGLESVELDLIQM